MKKYDAKALIGSMRVPFLVLPPVSILVGFAVAQTSLTQTAIWDLLLIIICALSAHISVNLFNEYHDYQTGLDAKTVRTPFSGGSGALIQTPSALGVVRYAAVITFFITTLIGLYFVYCLGGVVLPLGALGLVIILTYTQWLNRHPFLCLIAPGLAFGPLMVMGTDLVLTGSYSATALFVSLVPFFLVNNLLLLNQYPDIDADKSIGRYHFPIAYGVKKSTMLYGLFVVVTALVIVIGVLFGILPVLSVLTLLPLAGGLVVLFGAVKYAQSITRLVPYMGLNVVTTLLTPVVLSLTILYG